MSDLRMTPREIRASIESGKLRMPTSGLAPGYAQANLVILPQKYAFDFLLFCQRNPKSCPVIDVCGPGNAAPPLAAPDADIRTQIPGYRVFRRGKPVEERDSIKDIFTEDMVSFLIGCSFTFEAALIRNNIPVRHIELNRNVPMYITNRECIPAGIFSGPVVVSMRPVPEHLVQKSADITAAFGRTHGSPLHAGDPAELGIHDIHKVDFGDPPVINKGEVPVFWPCGVTPQAAMLRAKPEIAITHAPGYMFICDITEAELNKSDVYLYKK